MPSSAMTPTAIGRTCVASLPAENASKRSPPSARWRPSAIWLRAELCEHKNRIRLLLCISAMLHSYTSPLTLRKFDLRGDHPGHFLPSTLAFASVRAAAVGTLLAVRAQGHPGRPHLRQPELWTLGEVMDPCHGVRPLDRCCDG